MTLLSIAPDIVAGASQDLEDLGSALRGANAAAATQTTSVAAPAADEVSAAFTALLSTHAQGFQALSVKAAAFHDEFVNLLSGASAQYVSTEAANAGSAAAISLPALGISLPTLEIEELLTATGGVKTPFGVLNLLTANGTASIFPDGDLQASLTARVLSLPPLSLSVNGTPVSSTTGFEEALTATGTVKTPFGVLNLLTANGTATIFPDGGLQASLTARVLSLPPLSLSVNGTPVSSTTGFEEALTATGTVNTPFGVLNLLTANGTTTILADGDLQASITARVPLLPPLSLSVNGTPVSPLTLLTANESANISADGANQASLIARTPGSVTGIVDSDGAFRITGGSVNLDGLQLSL